jgi:hypothetical protein
MKNVIGWIMLICLGALTLLDASILCLGQFGFEFNQGGAIPRGLQYGWLALACKVVGLGVSRRTGVLMIIGGLIDWTYSIFLPMQSQHMPFVTALSNSPLDGAYLLLAVIYIVVTGRLWVKPTHAVNERIETGR